MFKTQISTQINNYNLRKNNTTIKNYILRKMDLKFQSPNFNIFMLNSILEQVKVAE